MKLVYIKRDKIYDQISIMYHKLLLYCLRIFYTFKKYTSI